MSDKNKWNMSGSQNQNNSPKGNGGGDDPQKPGGEFDWSKMIKTVLSWGAVLIGAVIIFQFMYSKNTNAFEITFDVYERLLNSDKIEEAKIIKTDPADYIFEGILKQEERILINGNATRIKKFQVTMVEPVIEKQLKIWDDKNLKYTFIKESNEWITVLLGILPWVLIVGIWILFMRRMQSGAGGTRGIFNFGKSKAKLISETQIKVTFKDVAGADEAKQELEEIIEFLKEPSKFQKLGGKIPRGVLLLGPPGTGKTLLARAVAGEAGVPFFSISGADFVEMFVGVGASRVRDLFEQGKKKRAMYNIY